MYVVHHNQPYDLTDALGAQIGGFIHFFFIAFFGYSMTADGYIRRSLVHIGIEFISLDISPFVDVKLTAMLCNNVTF